jgi:hypothetical protein
MFRNTAVRDLVLKQRMGCVQFLNIVIFLAIDFKEIVILMGNKV